MIGQICNNIFSHSTCASDNWAPYGAAALACGVTALFLKNCFQGPNQVAPIRGPKQPELTLGEVTDILKQSEKLGEILRSDEYRISEKFEKMHEKKVEKFKKTKRETTFGINTNFPEPMQDMQVMRVSSPKDRGLILSNFENQNIDDIKTNINTCFHQSSLFGSNENSSISFKSFKACIDEILSYCERCSELENAQFTFEDWESNPDDFEFTKADLKSMFKNDDLKSMRKNAHSKKLNLLLKFIHELLIEIQQTGHLEIENDPSIEELSLRVEALLHKKLEIPNYVHTAEDIHNFSKWRWRYANGLVK